MRAFFVCNMPDVVCFGLTLAQAAVPQKPTDHHRSQQFGHLCQSQSRRASSLRIVAQNLECSFQERMQRAPGASSLIPSPASNCDAQ